MTELKTKVNAASVSDFLNSISDTQKRKDSFILLKMLEGVTNEKPMMWGASIVGFGKYHYKSERSKQEGDWPLIGFSPRKQNLPLYVVFDFKDSEKLLEKLGKHTKSVGCLYIKDLSDVDIKVLEEFLKKSFETSKKLHLKT